MVTLCFAPLAFDIPEGIIPIILVVLYTIAQIIGNREPKPRVERPKPPRPGRPPAAGPEGGEPANLEDTLRREVEAFLNRAQGKDAPEKAPPARPAAAKPEQPRPTRPQQPQREPVARPRPPQPTAVKLPPRAPAAPAPPARPVGKPLRDTSVAEHVSQHISSSSAEFAEHASHLGEIVALADDRMDDHLREKFDHQLGSLKREQSTSGPAEATEDLAAEIREMLGRPDGIRQLIIANEILRRPEL